MKHEFESEKYRLYYMNTHYKTGEYQNASHFTVESLTLMNSH